MDASGNLIWQGTTVFDALLTGLDVLLAILILAAFWGTGALLSRAYGIFVRHHLRIVREEKRGLVTFNAQSKVGPPRKEAMRIPIAPQDVLANPDVLNVEHVDNDAREFFRSTNGADRTNDNNGVLAEEDDDDDDDVSHLSIFNMRRFKRMFSPHQATVKLHELVIQSIFGLYGLIAALGLLNLNLFQIIVSVGLVSLMARTPISTAVDLFSDWFAGIIISVRRLYMDHQIIEYQGGNVQIVHIGTFSITAVDVTNKMSFVARHMKEHREIVSIQQDSIHISADTDAATATPVAATADLNVRVEVDGQHSSEAVPPSSVLVPPRTNKDDYGLVRFYVIPNSHLLRHVPARWGLYNASKAQKAVAKAKTVMR
jgi:hypothetical protein